MRYELNCVNLANNKLKQMTSSALSNRSPVQTPMASKLSHRYEAPDAKPEQSFAQAARQSIGQSTNSRISPEPGYIRTRTSISKVEEKNSPLKNSSILTSSPQKPQEQERVSTQVFDLVVPEEMGVEIRQSPGSGPRTRNTVLAIREPTNTFDMYRRSFKGSRLHYIKNTPQAVMDRTYPFVAQTRAKTPASNAKGRSPGINIQTKSKEAAAIGSSSFMMFGSKFPLRESTPNRLGKRQSASPAYRPPPAQITNSQAVQHSGSGISIMKSQTNQTTKRNSINDVLTVQSQQRSKLSSIQSGKYDTLKGPRNDGILQGHAIIPEKISPKDRYRRNLDYSSSLKGIRFSQFSNGQRNSLAKIQANTTMKDLALHQNSSQNSRNSPDFVRTNTQKISPTRSPEGMSEHISNQNSPHERKASNLINSDMLVLELGSQNQQVQQSTQLLSTAQEPSPKENIHVDQRWIREQVLKQQQVPKIVITPHQPTQIVDPNDDVQIVTVERQDMEAVKKILEALPSDPSEQEFTNNIQMIVQNTLKQPCTHNHDLQVNSFRQLPSFRQLISSSLEGSPIHKKKGTISSQSESTIINKKSSSQSPQHSKERSFSQIQGLGNKHVDKQPMFSQRKMNEFMNQYYKTENLCNKDVAAVKLESMLTESPTYSNRQSRMTSSPKHIYLPRYNNERQNNDSSLRKPSTSKDSLLYTFSGQVLYSKVINENEEQSGSLEEEDVDNSNVLRLKPKEQYFSDLAIRQIENSFKITCQKHSNSKCNQETKEEADKQRSNKKKTSLKKSQSFLQMLTDKFGCQLVSEYLMNKSLTNMKRMIKIEQNSSCSCTTQKPGHLQRDWEPIHVATHTLHSNEATSMPNSPLNSNRMCEKCMNQNQFGRPLALLSQVYERQMEQRLSPVHQRKANGIPSSNTDPKVCRHHPGKRSQSVHHTRYFSRDAQERMVKDLKAEEMLEKERRSNVLKVKKIPNVANVRRGEYERQRAILLKNAARNSKAKSAVRNQVSKSCSAASIATTKKNTARYRLPYARQSMSDLNVNGSQEEIPIENIDPVQTVINAEMIPYIEEQMKRRHALQMIAQAAQSRQSAPGHAGSPQNQESQLQMNRMNNQDYNQSAYQSQPKQEHQLEALKDGLKNIYRSRTNTKMGVPNEQALRRLSLNQQKVVDLASVGASTHLISNRESTDDQVTVGSQRLNTQVSEQQSARPANITVVKSHLSSGNEYEAMNVADHESPPGSSSNSPGLHRMHGLNHQYSFERQNYHVGALPLQVESTTSLQGLKGMHVTESTKKMIQTFPEELQRYFTYFMNKNPDHKQHPLSGDLSAHDRNGGTLAGAQRQSRTEGGARVDRILNDGSGAGLSANMLATSSQLLQRQSRDESPDAVLNSFSIVSPMSTTHFKALKPTMLMTAHSASRGAHPYLINRAVKQEQATQGVFSNESFHKSLPGSRSVKSHQRNRQREVSAVNHIVLGESGPNQIRHARYSQNVLNQIRKSAAWNSPTNANADLIDLSSKDPLSGRNLPSSGNITSTKSIRIHKHADKHPSGGVQLSDSQFLGVLKSRIQQLSNNHMANSDLAHHMKIDENNEHPGETVKYTESSNRSKDKLDATPHGILGPKNFVKGSVCSARARAKQIEEERTRSRIRFEQLRRYQDKPLSADRERTHPATKAESNVSSDRVKAQSTKLLLQSGWRKVQEASKPNANYRIAGSFTKNPGSGKFFQEPQPPTLPQSPQSSSHPTSTKRQQSLQRFAPQVMMSQQKKFLSFDSDTDEPMPHDAPVKPTPLEVNVQINKSQVRPNTSGIVIRSASCSRKQSRSGSQGKSHAKSKSNVTYSISNQTK